MVANTFHHYKLYSHDGSDYSQGVTLMITSAGVNIPIGFNAAAMSPYDISLGWTLTAGNEVIVAVNSINSFGTPVTGNVYNANDPLAGGGTIIYRGPASSFIHTSLTPSTQYYYKAWSYNPYYSYSSGVSANAVTFCPPALLPFNEQFSGSSWPSCWKQSFSGNITSNRWAVSNSSYAGGSPYEMKAFWLNNTGTSRLISPPLNTTGVAALELSFRHFMEDYSGGATLKIQTSSDFINWNDATWFLLSGSGNAGPESIVLPITQDLGTLTYIAWVIEGDHLGYDNWYIDDVYILETSCPRPYQLSAVTTTNSAVLDWEESGSATSWQVEYGPLGFTPGTASQTQVTSLPYTLTGLSPATAYDYYVTAECGAGVFSGASGPFTFITQCEPEDLPYSNSFNTASWPQCWSESHSGEIAVNLWSTSILAAAGGSPYEMYATDFDGIGTSRLISLPLNTAGQTSLQLSFNHYMDDYDIGATFKIQTSTDLLTWTDAPWSVQSGNGDIGPETVSVEITQNLGGVIYIAWVIEGDHYAYDEWYMDDVNVTGGSGTLGLDVKVWLEGPFDGTQMTTALGTGGVLPLTQPYNTPPWNYSGTESVTAIPAGVVDWVLVELRDATDPSLAGSLATLPGWPRACFLRDDGKIVDLDGTSPPDIGNPVIGNNLYVVVRHRNHIDVISAFGAILSAGQYIYDFSTSIDQAYGGGSGYKMIAPGIYGMVSGDSDGDGSAFTTDFNAWASEFGNDNLYHNADLDLDGAVFTSDFNKWAGNFGFDNPVESGWNPLYTSQVTP